MRYKIVTIYGTKIYVKTDAELDGMVSEIGIEHIDLIEDRETNKIIYRSE
jgi:hypothetical protein